MILSRTSKYTPRFETGTLDFISVLLTIVLEEQIPLSNKYTYGVSANLLSLLRNKFNTECPVYFLLLAHLKSLPQMRWLNNV